MGAVAVLVGAGALVWTNTTVGRSPEQLASRAVEDYYRALTNADAEAALQLAAEPLTPGHPLLTDEALQVSADLGGIQDAQITDVQLDPDPTGESGGTGTVTATYSIDEEAQEERFDVIETPDGWRLDQVAAQTPVNTTTRINGQEPVGDVAMIFPGSYQITYPNDLIRYERDTDVIDDLSDSLSFGRAELAEGAEEAIRVAFEETVQHCVTLDGGSTNPVGCRFLYWSKPSGVDVESIEYDDDPIVEVTDITTMGITQVSAELHTEVGITAEVTEDDDTTSTLTTTLVNDATYLADITEKNHVSIDR